MKEVIVVLLSVYALSACQSTSYDAYEMGELDEDSKAYTENKIADINTQLGAGYIANGHYERAMLKLKKALKAEPNYAQAHNYLGVLYNRLERPEKASQEFKIAMKLAPNNPSILNNYAIFLCEQKEFDQAQQLFKKVTNNRLYANRANAYQSAGWCALSNDKLELSEKLYRESLEINSDSPPSLLGLAKVNYKKESYLYAWSYFERFYKLSVLDADSLWLGINILNNLNAPDKNLLSSFELQLKSKYPDSDETKWFYQGKQEY